jgi:hypothetical protein
LQLRTEHWLSEAREGRRERMVRLRKTQNLEEKLARLGSTDTNERKGLANDLPFELVEAVQEHLQDVKEQDWVDHTLLVRISKWNKSLDRMTPVLLAIGASIV